MESTPAMTQRYSYPPKQVKLLVILWACTFAFAFLTLFCAKTIDQAASLSPIPELRAIVATVAFGGLTLLCAWCSIQGFISIVYSFTLPRFIEVADSVMTVPDFGKRKNVQIRFSEVTSMQRQEIKNRPYLTLVHGAEKTVIVSRRMASIAEFEDLAASIATKVNIP